MWCVVFSHNDGNSFFAACSFASTENYRQSFLKLEEQWSKEAQKQGPVNGIQSEQFVLAQSSVWKRLVRAVVTRVLEE